jgi:hypothetical protein
MRLSYPNSKWKPPSTVAVFPSNSRPITNVDYSDLSTLNDARILRTQSAPKTITKTILAASPTGNSYYDPLKHRVSFTTKTTEVSGTSIPICTKSLPRPLKIWRKQLKPYYTNHSDTKVTIDQVNNPTTVVSTSCIANSHTIQEDINHLDKCVGVKYSNHCIGGSNAIRRNGGASRVKSNYSTTTREYLKRRVKSFEQNQTIGKKIDGTAYYSSSGYNTTDISGNCNKIYYNPSNIVFKCQGGVSSSTQTTRVRDNEIAKTNKKERYDIAQSTLDTGYIKDSSKNAPQPIYHAINDRAKIFCKRICN